MGLLNFIRRSWGTGYAETVSQSADRSNVYTLLPKDPALFIPAASRQRLREKYDWLSQNFGIVQGVRTGIARHVVGKGMPLVMNCKDRAWAKLAEKDFHLWASSPDRCDIAGRRSFYDAQCFGVEQYVGPGEFFAADSENPRWNGEPCFQLFDPAEIVSPPDKKNEVLDGVSVDKFYNPTAYYFRSVMADSEKYQPIAANIMTHWFKPTTANQVRGVPPCSPSINNLVDIHELKRLTAKTAKAQMLVSMVMKGIKKKRTKGAFGGLASTVGGSELDGAADTAAFENVYQGAGAAIAYLGEDGDAKLLSSNSPSPLVEQFITDLLLRDFCSAQDVPTEFFWNPEKLGGANSRFVISRADLMFQKTADELIQKWLRRTAFRVLSWRIQQGLLPQPTDPDWHYGIDFQTPRRITVDNGRDTAAEKMQLDSGLITLRELYNQRGLDWREETRQWIRESLEFMELAAEEGAPPDLMSRWESNLPLWRAHATGAGVAMNGDKSDSKEKEKPEKDESE